MKLLLLFAISEGCIKAFHLHFYFELVLASNPSCQHVCALKWREASSLALYKLSVT